MSRVQVTGLRELNKRLAALPAEIAGKRGGPLLAALRKTAQPVRDDAKRRAPVRSGALQKAIIIARVRKRAPGEEAVEVTIRFKARRYKDNRRNRRIGRVGETWRDYGVLYYARFMEFGTETQPAHPFIRPAWEANKSQLPHLLKVELSAAIAKAVAKMRIR